MFFFAPGVLFFGWRLTHKRAELYNGSIMHKRKDAFTMYLISPNKKQYKANLHCHSVLSDGKKKPEELKQMYKAHGYDVLAITDHERPHQHQAMNDDDFIMLTGYEAYIRPDQSGHYNRYAKEVHLKRLFNDFFNE